MTELNKPILIRLVHEIHKAVSEGKTVEEFKQLFLLIFFVLDNLFF